ncbi:hypothetical protein SPF06_07145 [Sinomonas sp. JGH33]|uniref:Uncharacterized protein n=1 Tax=Sinomonas terricola TaxID=3110330 RepID=A0ABU5T4G4_9MICC|nr:hypothetical protein [Sinomonas sp. JGH33]MEA5454493.1 hypothetical protein [Sinomonas sp. JGH33]
MSSPSRAIARRRRLAFVYTPVFTLGAFVVIAAAGTLNGAWAFGAFLMAAAVVGVALDLERPTVNEKPAQPTKVDVFDLGTGRNPEADAALLPFPEERFDDTPQGGDAEFAAASDAAHDAYDAVGDALENGELDRAAHHARFLLARIRHLQTLDAQEAQAR